jgi:PadR family transcriptional regulator, regulatory protein PadR
VSGRTGFDDAAQPPPVRSRRRFQSPLRCAVSVDLGHRTSLQSVDAFDFFCDDEEMPRRQLNDVELLVLLALIRLSPEAYGVPIAREIESRGKRRIALGTVYAILDRLQHAGLVASEMGESTPERGGRARRYFHITDQGLFEVRSVHSALVAMSGGLTALKGRPI